MFSSDSMSTDLTFIHSWTFVGFQSKYFQAKMKIVTVFFCFVLIISAVFASPVQHFVETKETQPTDKESKMVQ